jgi:SPP1 family predicted phage head-tail adaptor
MGTINAGELRDRVEVLKLSGGQTDRGQPAATAWKSGGFKWAKVVPLRADESESARQIYAKATHRVVVRRMNGLTAKDRLRHGDKVLEIGGVKDLGQDGTELLCGEVVNVATPADGQD